MRIAGRRKQILKGSIAMGALIAFSQAVPAYAQQQTYSFDIPAQDLGSALRAFARASRQQVTFDDAAVRGKRAPALKGSYTAEQALEQLLSGSGLSVQRGRSGLFIVRAASQAQASARKPLESSGGEEDVGATPDILVTGRRTINVDIRRTENDTQPYVVLDAEEIAASNVSNVEEFLKTRLPMNEASATFSNSLNPVGSGSVNLRGLGTNQTLILIDGRRVASNNYAGDLQQLDISGISPAMIERIEILPSTASGIYGGGATGGVINIITKKDYSGITASARYGAAFRGDASEYRFDVTGGLRLNEGRTNLIFMGSFSGAEPLLVRDRDFVARSRALQFQNNPSAILNASTPILGATPNIRSANGSVLVLRNGTSLGAANTFVPAGYAGVNSDQGAALVANAGRYNLALADIATSGGGTTTLYEVPESLSLNGNLRHEFSPAFEAFAELSYRRSSRDGLLSDAPTSVRLPAGAASNPFTTDVIVRFPPIGLAENFSVENEQYRALAGLIYRFAPNWVANLDYSWSRATHGFVGTQPIVGDPDGSGPGKSIATALADGTIDVFRDFNAYPQDFSPYLFPEDNYRKHPATTTLNSAGVRVSGPLLRLPGGTATLTTLLEYRDEKLSETVFEQTNATTAAKSFTVYPIRKQSVVSGYTEVRLPLVRDANNIPGIQSFELQGSARYDRYKTVAPNPARAVLTSLTGPRPASATVENEVDAIKFTVSGKYSPFDGLFFRASYGTGFLPPAVNQVVPDPITSANIIAIDPKRGNLAVPSIPIPRATGGNPDLQPEHSTSWSIGGVLEPAFAPGLRLSVDYVNIRKIDEILPISDQAVLNLEDALPGRVSRAPLTEADRALGFTGGVITAIDRTSVNVGRTRLEAWDFQIDYAIETRSIGSFSLSAVATYQPHLQRQTVVDGPNDEYVDRFTGVLKWRGNVGVIWKKGAVSAGWNAQYYHSYFVYFPGFTEPLIAPLVLNHGSSRIPAEIYNDAFLTVDIGKLGSREDSNLQLSVGVQNIFDKKPAVFGTGFGTYSQYGDPRLRRFTVTARTSF